MHKIEYGDRALIINPYHYCIILDEETYNAELDRLKVSSADRYSWLKPNADATTHFFHLKEAQKNIAIVCLNDKKKVSDTQKVALIVHEAVHIWQFIEEYIGEINTSKEFEAYSIQGIVQELLFSYDKAKNSISKRKQRAKKD